MQNQRDVSPLAERLREKAAKVGDSEANMEQARYDNQSKQKRDTKFMELMRYDQDAVFQELYEKTERQKEYSRKHFTSVGEPATRSLIKDGKHGGRSVGAKGGKYNKTANKPRVTFNLDLNIIENQAAKGQAEDPKDVEDFED